MLGLVCDLCLCPCGWVARFMRYGLCCLLVVCYGVVFGFVC